MRPLSLLLFLPGFFQGTYAGHRKTLLSGFKSTDTWLAAHSESEPLVQFNPSAAPTDFSAIATECIGLYDQSHLPRPEFLVRPDSYTDDTTGISHIYARQLINGLELVDGDVSINVKDGKVLSYASSFSDVPDDLVSPYDVFAEGSPALDAPDSEGPAQAMMGTDGSHSSLWRSASVHENVKSAVLFLISVVTPSRDTLSHVLGSEGRVLREKIEIKSLRQATQSSREVVLLDNVPDAIDAVKAHLAYATDSLGKPQLVWKFEVEMPDNWYEAAVSVQTPHRILAIVDWVADSPASNFNVHRAHYNVYPLGVNDPAVGERSLQAEHNDRFASPLGWHALPYANDPSVSPSDGIHQNAIRNTTTTWGNNVFAQANWEARDTFIDNYRPDAGPAKLFDYEYNPQPGDQKQALLEAREYVNATVTHLFYITNLLHDLFYRYGFTEAAGNFQQHNFGRGGKENDAVIIHAQDGSGMNNGNFATPPDGKNPRCRMYLWDTAYPYRDGGFDESVLVHELAHGLSSRLTGGPDNSACMGFGESNGMGEGWSDFIALMIQSKKGITDYPAGVWVGNKPEGLRRHLYSLNMTTNPLTYSILNQARWREVHAMGEVWTSILWEVAQSLIAVHGYRGNYFPAEVSADGKVPLDDFYRASDTRIPKHGDTLAMQLVINGMKLQPCRPTFFQARDSIILADGVLTNGENLCTLWNAFAKRGLGVDAQYKNPTPSGGGRRVDGFDVPDVCKK